MSFFELNDLTTGYADKHGAKAISSHLNAQLQQGKLTCMLGPNGAGKSTLLRTMAAFQPALEGQIIVDDKPLATYTMQQLAQKISIVLTDSPKNMNMTVEEVVSLGRSPYTGFWGKMHEADWKAVNDSLKLIGIEDFRYRRLSSLSDGERQKVMIAKSITQGTPLIFLDEPTAFLDYPSKVEVLQLLRRLAAEEQKTIFLSTHDVELALQLADRLWLMDTDGLSVGTPHELSAQGALSRFIERPGITFDTATLQIRVKTV